MRYRYNRINIAALVVLIGLASTSVFAQSLPPRLSSETENGKNPELSRFLINKISAGDMRYVAVGDSYTIGTGAKPKQSWPALLTRDLQKHGLKIDLAANLGIAGWTTSQALDEEMMVFKNQKPEFATLMIGVNDTYRATTAEQFRTQLQSLIDQMQVVLPDKSKILLVTIPDFTVTPSGAEFAAQSGGTTKIVAFNDIIKDEAATRGLPVVDVFALSQKMGTDHTLVARDGLHPSAKEYALWEKLIFPAVQTMLEKKP